jgi:hypothetical protein
MKKEKTQIYTELGIWHWDQEGKRDMESPREDCVIQWSLEGYGYRSMIPGGLKGEEEEED